MKPLLHPRLINTPDEDPGLLVEFLFERRALLFDLGDLAPVPPRTLLRVTHAFVTHAHMDHFAGFDRLLRVCLGREKALHLFGPEGFVDRVAGRLAGYTWNLAPGYANDFVIAATALHADGSAMSAEFHSRRAFAREAEREARVENGVLLREDALTVRAAVLDHGTPCLALRVEEPAHVNVWKSGLEALGLTTGPWLRDLKRAVLRGEPDDTPIRAARPGDGEAVLPLGRLRAGALSTTPGQAIAYVVDAGPPSRNGGRIVDLARGAEALFIEAPFLDADAELAAQRNHLTAGQAGRLAAAAGVGRIVPFHFSPRYAGREAELAAEAETAFREGLVGPRGAPDR
ncbi:ribonuclease Z [Azospirillum sp. TSO22-1]|nr:ribonuclease Z [Azospirillum sp. TSO22-1]